MTILLDDISDQADFFPFGQVKSIALMRIGMLKILERWQHFFGGNVFLRSTDPGVSDHAFSFPATQIPSFSFLKNLQSKNVPEGESITLQNVTDLFKYNDWVMREDYKILTLGKERAALPPEIRATKAEDIFIEPGADISYCSINAATGPVYISENATIMEGAMIRGPVFCGEHSVVKMGAKIYGATTIGPYCIAGGEIKNAVIMGFTNKAHDGYLGDSVLGEWCNIGAGTSNSNLKNNASEVSIKIGSDQKMISAGIKCGLIMGDYSRSAINTSFNTGTVVGVSSNILEKQPEKFINNFSWGNGKYDFEKAIRDINNWKKLKGFGISQEEISSLKSLYKIS